MAGGSAPIVPNKIPVMIPVRMTEVDRLSVNVPTEKGMVRPSRNIVAQRRAIKVPLSVASSDSWSSDSSRALRV